MKKPERAGPEGAKKEPNTDQNAVYEVHTLIVPPLFL